MSRCTYCKKQGADQKTAVRMFVNGKLNTMEWSYCSPACKENIHSFIKSYNRFAPKFMLFVLGWIILMFGMPLLLQALTGNPYFMQVVPPVGMTLMGVALIIFPFGIATTQYYRVLGIKYTNLIVRLTGLVMIIAGVGMLWLR